MAKTANWQTRTGAQPGKDKIDSTSNPSPINPPIPEAPPIKPSVPETPPIKPPAPLPEAPPMKPQEPEVPQIKPTTLKASGKRK